MLLMENKFCKLLLHDDYVEFIWMETTESMTEEEYKEIMQEWASIAEEHQPSKLLLDIVNNKFLLSPEIQEWTDQNIFTRTHEAGLKKDAFIAPKNIVALMSVEQLFDEANVSKKERKFFDEREEALKWLLND